MFGKLNVRHAGLVALSLAAVAFAVWFVVPTTAFAQEQPPVAKPGAPEVTLVGKIVDLHCYMTGEYANPDHAKCAAECLRNGVPAALETPKGLFLLGAGTQGFSRKAAALAHEDVEVKGKLYEKHGVKYVDVIEMKKVGGDKPALDKPAKPVKPETPAKPEAPAKPETPAKPEAPAKPETPANQ